MPSWGSGTAQTASSEMADDGHVTKKPFYNGRRAELPIGTAW